jgi:hypothetical protein
MHYLLFAVFKSGFFFIYLINNFDSTSEWTVVWIKLKVFFVLVFYFILMMMYSIHFIETASKFSNSYTVIATQKKEVTMKNKSVLISPNKTKDQLNQPGYHY